MRSQCVLRAHTDVRRFEDTRLGFDSIKKFRFDIFFVSPDFRFRPQQNEFSMFHLFERFGLVCRLPEPRSRSAQRAVVTGNVYSFAWRLLWRLRFCCFRKCHTNRKRNGESTMRRAALHTRIATVKWQRRTTTNKNTQCGVNCLSNFHVVERATEWRPSSVSAHDSIEPNARSKCISDQLEIGRGQTQRESYVTPQSSASSRQKKDIQTIKFAFRWL